MIKKGTKGVFIKFLAVLAGAATVFISCRSGDAVTDTRFFLGTACTITVYSGGHQKAVDHAFIRVEEIEEMMSVNIESSEVSEINRNAGMHPVEVAADTFAVIEEALEAAKLSGGALDITVGPLVEAWGIGSESAQIPPDAEIDRLLSLVDYKYLVLDRKERTVFLEKKGMRIDLGAVAKGYAADAAEEVLKKEGVDRGIIDFGGNIRVFGSKPKEPWRVGIQKPGGTRGEYFGIISGGEMAVVSSGTYERYFEAGGVRYHHILDPETGYPVQNSLVSATVVAPDALRADALSTAVFAMGLEEGFRLLITLPGAEGIFVTGEMNVVLTPDLEDRFVLTDKRYTLTSRRTAPTQ
jgi:FAD:protein FMN transferase